MLNNVIKAETYLITGKYGLAIEMNYIQLE